MPLLYPVLQIPPFSPDRRVEEYLPQLVQIINRVYQELSAAIVMKPDLAVKMADPTANDYAYLLGSIWLNKANSTVWILMDKDNNVAVWNQL